MENQDPIILGENLVLVRNVYRYVIVGWVVLFFGFFLVAIWACFAPIDEGVPSYGYVISESNRKEIRYLSGGVVDNIFVKEGDFVKAGQLLVVMNPVQAKSTRNASDQSIFGLQEQIRGLKTALNEKQKQLVYAKEQEKSLLILVDDGFAPISKLFDVQKEIAQISASIAEDIGTVEKSNRQIKELNERKVAYQFDLDNTEIKSPVDGFVVGLSVFTKGGVVLPGTHFMDIAPSKDNLIVEAQIPVNLIDKVKKNSDVEVLFTALNQSKTPHLAGKVLMVSADKFIDEKTGASYFKIRASIDPSEKRYLKNTKIVLGMPAEVLVKTGERTFMSYLLKPIFDRAYNSFREN